MIPPWLDPVQYRCGCRGEPPASDSGGNGGGDGTARSADDDDDDDGGAWHSLRELLFCEECVALRCDRCVSTEVVSVFCTHCLTECEPPPPHPPRDGADGALGRWRCTGGCACCPLCGAQTRSRGVPDSRGGAHELLCRACGWTSAGMLVTALEDAVEQCREQDARAEDDARFQALVRQHLAQTDQTNQMLQKYRAAMLTDPVPAARHWSPNAEASHKLGPLPPLLRAERKIRCRSCRQVLVNPRPRRLGLECKQRLAAVDVVPSVSIARDDIVKLIRLTNPMREKIRIVLSGQEVRIDAPDLTVGGTMSSTFGRGDLTHAPELETCANIGELAGRERSSAVVRVSILTQLFVSVRQDEREHGFWVRFSGDL